MIILAIIYFISNHSITGYFIVFIYLFSLPAIIAMNEINFFFNGTSISLPNRKSLKCRITNLFFKEGIRLSTLNYIFCSDEFLLSINKEFLGHDDFTDIITFSLGLPGQPISGEVYISTDRLRENAAKHGVTILNELHRLLFHGALHLCGYKDKTFSAKKVMTSREDYYLANAERF